MPRGVRKRSGRASMADELSIVEEDPPDDAFEDVAENLPDDQPEVLAEDLDKIPAFWMSMSNEELSQKLLDEQKSTEQAQLETNQLTMDSSERDEEIDALIRQIRSENTQVHQRVAVVG